MAVYQLENEHIYLEVASHGAELVRLVGKKTKKEYLFDGDPKYWKRHSPILFPFVGGVKNREYRYNGKTYTMTQHGFARDSEFKCIHAGKETSTFLLTSTEEMKEVYPFDFELFITYTLEKNVLHVKWEVKNPSDETIYFTIGAHPAFRFAKNEEGKTDYILKFPGKEELKYCLINMKEMAPDPEELHEMKLEEETYPLTEELFENDALIFDNTQIEEAWICHKDGTPYVGVKSEGFPSYGIWSVKDAPFVCLEPWMGRCDNIGFDKEISEKPGINKVESGETFEKEYQIVVAI